MSLYYIRGYRKGDRVVMTEDGIRNRLNGTKNSRTGVIVGFSRDKFYLRIKRDGYKDIGTYHPRFWTLAK
jgi:hypothetical protein